MNEWTDQQLLRDYASHRSEGAFAELVRRHIDLVYSAALRMVCDTDLAKDVSQNTFLALAQSAPRLVDRPVLSGWLHRTAQNLAAKVVRSDVRRRHREQEAATMNELLSAEPDANWEHIAPHLDAALGELTEPDRDAVLLRYFERKSARQMADVFGTSEDAAQKRVSRAVERLREFFAKRGITVGASGLVVVISANAVQAAPIGLVATITTAAGIAGTTIAAATAVTATKTIAMTILNKTIIGATLAAAVGTAVYQVQIAAHLREEQQNLLTTVAELERQRDAALSPSTRVVVDDDQLSREKSELLRLRNQVAMLRRETNEMARLRNENNELRAERSSKPAATTPRADTAAGESVPRDQWTFMGYSEPDSTIRSMHWAFSRGDVQAVLASLSPSERALMEERWTGHTEGEIAEGIRNDNDNKLVSGYRITNREIISDNMMVLTIYQEGRNKEKKVWLERINSEWKVSRAPAPRAGS